MANKVKRNFYLSEQIEIRNKIAEAIKNGTIKADGLLPSKKSIAEENQCTMDAVTKAFNILVAEGYIYKNGTRFYASPSKQKPITTSVKEIHNQEKRPATYEAKKNDTKTEKVKKYILECIESGKYKQDEVLPPVKDIAAQCVCSNATVSYAINSLVQEKHLQAFLFEGHRSFAIYGSKLVSTSENKSKSTTKKHKYNSLYNYIKERISNGSYKPGDIIDLQALSSEFDYKCPRKAMSKLKAEGLVETINLGIGIGYRYRVKGLREEPKISRNVISRSRHIFPDKRTEFQIKSWIPNVDVVITPVGKSDFEICLKREA